MAAAAEPASPSSQLVRDAFAILFEGWSPAELLQLDPNTDVLSQSLPAVIISGRQRLQLQQNMWALQFDVLHSFWDPLRRVGAGSGGIPTERQFAMWGGKGDELSSSLRMSASEAGEGSATPSISAKLSKIIDPMHTLFSGTDLSVAQSCGRNEQIFRIVVEIEGCRKFTVERSQGHVTTFLQCVRYTFPHLLVPFVTDVTLSGVAATLSFINHNAPLLSTYFPCLFFLFESNPKSFLALFSILSDTVRQRMLQEDLAFQQTKPKKKSSWFSIGSSKIQDQGPLESEVHGFGMAFKDELKFLEEDEKKAKSLADGFKSRYQFMANRQETVAELLNVSVKLRRAMDDECRAWEGVAETFTEIQATLTDDPIAGWGEEGAGPGDEATVAPPSLADVNKVVKAFTTVVSVLQGQVTLPMAVALQVTVGETELHAMSIRQFLRSMIQRAKFVHDKEGLINGKEDIRESPAAGNPAIMAQIKEIYAKQRTTLRSQKQNFSGELSRTGAALRSSLSRACTVVHSMGHHLTDAFDTKHYNDLLRRFPGLVLPATVPVGSEHAVRLLLARVPTTVNLLPMPDE